MTEFQPKPLAKPGGKLRRHDWRDYVDAWDLLKPPQLTMDV